MSKKIHEMRAYGCPGDETDYEIVGWIVLDEDKDTHVRDIYTDLRMPVCGSNWSLRETNIEPKDEVPSNKYFHGDWYGKGAVKIN